MNPPKPAPRILNKRLFVPVFMPFAFAGLMCLLFPLIMLVAECPICALQQWWLVVLGASFIGVALRPRVVRLDEADACLSIEWGLRWSWVYRRIEINEWAGFSVTQEFPVGVTPRHQGTVSVTALPPQWHLKGMTKQGKSISFGVYPSESEAVGLRKRLEQQVGWFGQELPIRVKLSYGVGRVVAPSSGWHDEPFFKSHPQEAILYEQLGKAGSWRCLRGGSIYDADLPDELGRDDFDIPLLASQVRLSRPWRLMRSMEEQGWVGLGSANNTPIAELADLEARFGWAVPMMRERMPLSTQTKHWR